MSFIQFLKTRNPMRLLFPHQCLLCQASPSSPLCELCLLELEAAGRGCAKCGNPAAATAIEGCPWCARLRVLPQLLWSPLIFRATGRQIYHLVKYQHYWRLIPELIDQALTRQPLDRSWFTFDCLVPIPEVIGSQFKRPFNPSKTLATSLARRTSIEVRQLLKIRRFGAHQVGLGLKERRANMRGRFSVQVEPPESVLLVDDVLTTGATLESATLALTKAGVKRIGWLVLFRTI